MPIQRDTLQRLDGGAVIGAVPSVSIDLVGPRRGTTQVIHQQFPNTHGVIEIKQLQTNRFLAVRNMQKYKIQS